MNSLESFMHNYFFPKKIDIMAQLRQMGQFKLGRQESLSLKSNSVFYTWTFKWNVIDSLEKW